MKTSIGNLPLHCQTDLPLFSIIIPAHNEEGFIGRCLDSIAEASHPYHGQVETIVVLNRCTDGTQRIAESYGAVIVSEDRKNLAAIRNSGARHARGEILITIDADSWMSSDMLQQIRKTLLTAKVIGGGVNSRPERLSLGIICSMVYVLFKLAPRFLIDRISGGLFWCYRKDFNAFGGFDDTLVCVEDIDFALRLKAYGKTQGKRFVTLRKAYITSSCRKFDIFGDWYLLKNPKLVDALIDGHDQEAANSFYYDVER